MLFLDGLYVGGSDGRPPSCPIEGPSKQERTQLVQTIAKRAVYWCRDRTGLGDDAGQEMSQCQRGGRIRAACIS